MKETIPFLSKRIPFRKANETAETNVTRSGFAKPRLYSMTDILPYRNTASQRCLLITMLHYVLRHKHKIATPKQPFTWQAARHVLLRSLPHVKGAFVRVISFFQ
jgi:hypothetical protein